MICTLCGETAVLDGLHHGDVRVEVDWLPCCVDARDLADPVFLYGATWADLVAEELGYDVVDVDLEDSTLVCRLVVDQRRNGGEYQREVFAAVDLHHRHHDHPQGWRFGVTAWNGPIRVGVAVVGRPLSRLLQAAEPGTVEVTRVCTWGHPALRRNASSKLYGAACAEAKRRGFDKVITYTLVEEDGASLRASGFHAVAETRGGSWNRAARQREDKAPTGRKVRWERELGRRARRVAA